MLPEALTITAGPVLWWCSAGTERQRSLEPLAWGLGTERLREPLKAGRPNRPARSGNRRSPQRQNGDTAAWLRRRRRARASPQPCCPGRRRSGGPRLRRACARPERAGREAPLRRPRRAGKGPGRGGGGGRHGGAGGAMSGAALRERRRWRGRARFAGRRESGPAAGRPRPRRGGGRR